MNTLLMGDSSTPPPSYPPYPVWGFYVGGDTPHIWPDDEYHAIPCRWVLPIFTASNPGRDAAADAAEIVAWLHAHRYKPGEVVAVDTETSVLPGYLLQLTNFMHDAGFALMDYESKGPELDNPLTSGGRWIADWTGVPHLYPGSVATQFRNSKMTGHPWDESQISAAVRLHELNPPVTRHITYVNVDTDLPELLRGDTGPAVARLQALLDAWLLHTGESLAIDGQFGPATSGQLAAFQQAHGVTPADSVSTAETWAKLLTI